MVIKESKEKTLYEYVPKRKLFWLWVVKSIIIVLLLVLLFLPYFIALKTVNITSYIFTIIIFALIYAIYLFYINLLFKTYKYKITNKGIYFNGGIITKREKYVPFYKITNVEVLRPLLDQILGISRLGFQTAGNGYSQIPEITFMGLTDYEKPKKIVLSEIEKIDKK